MKKIIVYVSSIVASLLYSNYALAQNYGEGAYSQCTYQTCNLHIGPITLPATGPTVFGALSILALVIGGIWLVMLRRRRKRELASQEIQS